MTVFYSKTSLKYLARLENDIRSNIISAVEALPNRGDIRKMKGRSLQNLFRLRVGKFGVLYIRESEAIKILDIDVRGDIYK